MRVLWFTNTPSRYKPGSHPYYGGGWIDSLEALIQGHEDVDLGISFYHPSDTVTVTRSNLTYYPILRKSAKRRPLIHLLHSWTGRMESEASTLPELLSVIDDFAPDVIHVFGTEGPFSSVQTHTRIPVVIHLQGLINPCANAFFPPGQSRSSLLTSRFLVMRNLLGLGPFASHQRQLQGASREAQNLRQATYVMGRTEWDHRVAQWFNPDVEYFKVNEVLRPPFYHPTPSRPSWSSPRPVRILSTLSPILFKGVDVILKTARLLHAEAKLSFEWTILGISEFDPILRHFTRSTRTQPGQLSLKFVGSKSPEELAILLQNSDMFVHPSYIDNSPNSVCEAQILGVPVIACRVGGIDSLITHQQTGILVPANGIFELASWILDLSRDQTLAQRLGSEGRRHALVRHDRQTIVSGLLEVYHTMKKDPN